MNWTIDCDATRQEEIVIKDINKEWLQYKVSVSLQITGKEMMCF